MSHPVSVLALLHEGQVLISQGLETRQQPHDLALLHFLIDDLLLFLLLLLLLLLLSLPISVGAGGFPCVYLSRQSDR